MNFSDFKKMKVMTEGLQLQDRVYADGTPCNVTVYLDQENSRVFQMDIRSGLYRGSKEGQVADYGDWQNFDKSK